jgi:hypothetical protein
MEKVMNKGEIQQWIKDHECVDNSFEHDKSGNEWQNEVYEVDGEYYQIGHCNGHVCRDIPYKRDSEPTYTPTKVVKEEVVITKTVWHRATVWECEGTSGCNMIYENDDSSKTLKEDNHWVFNDKHYCKECAQFLEGQNHLCTGEHMWEYAKPYNP